MMELNCTMITIDLIQVKILSKTLKNGTYLSNCWTKLCYYPNVRVKSYSIFKRWYQMFTPISLLVLFVFATKQCRKKMQIH